MKQKFYNEFYKNCGQISNNKSSCITSHKKTRNEPRHEISNNVVCLTSKASDQPAHTRSLIKASDQPYCWKSHVTAQMCPGTSAVAKITSSDKQTKNDIWAIILEAMGWGFRNLSILVLSIVSKFCKVPYEIT